MKLLKRLALPAIAAIAALPAQAQAPIEATLSVDLQKAGPKIERAVYGQFAEHLGRGVYEGIWVGPNSKIPNTSGYRNDVLAALKRLQIPVVRWPGGCFADEYNWRDGIGPRGQRPKRINHHWGGVIEDNSFGTHEFMNYSEMLGADAYVAGNMGSLTPLDMGYWFEYMTYNGDSTLAAERRKNGRDKPWKVKYFGVGNESWGCGGNMRPEYSADLHRRYQTFVKTQRGNDPVIKVATGANVDDYKFTEALMREARHTMQAVSIHYYTFADSWDNKGRALGFGEDEWASTLANAIRMDELVTKHSAIMDKYDPEKKIGLYVDEWGTWWADEPNATPGFLNQQSSLRDAQVAALTLNIFHRHTDRVKLAAIAQMVNVLQAMILTDKEKMLLTPTYHIFDMYLPFQGATPYAASVKGPDYVRGKSRMAAVDASVARGADGRLYLSLVNVDPNRPARVTTSLSGSATGRLLTGAALDTHNSFERPNTIQPIAYSGRNVGGKLVFDLPAKSIAVVAVQ